MFIYLVELSSTNSHSPKTALTDARVSIDEQARTDYTIHEGYEVLEEGADRAELSFPGKVGSRDRVRNLAAAGNVSVVLAQDRDSFAWNPAYFYLLREEFEQHGTALRDPNDCGDDSLAILKLAATSCVEPSELVDRE